MLIHVSNLLIKLNYIFVCGHVDNIIRLSTTFSTFFYTYFIDVHRLMHMLTSYTTTTTNLYLIIIKLGLEHNLKTISQWQIANVKIYRRIRFI